MEINSLVKKVIQACYEVHKELGHGFNEKVYEKSLSIVLRDYGIAHQLQHPINVFFRSEPVGEFFADVLIDQSLIVELKAVASLESKHKAQVLNYLKGANLETGILVNFGSQNIEVNRLYNTSVKSKPSS